MQAHTQLLCVTTATSGTLRITTGAGTVSVPYDAFEILQPPTIVSVTPALWSTDMPTQVVLQGQKYVLAGGKGG